MKRQKSNIFRVSKICKKLAILRQCDEKRVKVSKTRFIRFKKKKIVGGCELSLLGSWKALWKSHISHLRLDWLTIHARSIKLLYKGNLGSSWSQVVCKSLPTFTQCTSQPSAKSSSSYAIILLNTSALWNIMQSKVYNSCAYLFCIRPIQAFKCPPSSFSKLYNVKHPYQKQTKKNFLIKSRLLYQKNLAAGIYSFLLSRALEIWIFS